MGQHYEIKSKYFKELYFRIRDYPHCLIKVKTEESRLRKEGNIIIESACEEVIGEFDFIGKILFVHKSKTKIVNE